jgi:hypothetical protein
VIHAHFRPIYSADLLGHGVKPGRMDQTGEGAVEETVAAPLAGELLGSVLDGFAGLFHVFAEPMGGAATESNEAHEGGEEDDDKNALK